MMAGSSHAKRAVSCKLHVAVTGSAHLLFGKGAPPLLFLCKRDLAGGDAGRVIFDTALTKDGGLQEHQRLHARAGRSGGNRAAYSDRWE